MKHPRGYPLFPSSPRGPVLALSLLALTLFAGCSTHPIVDTRDCLFPGRLTKEEVAPYGGVCRPQGAVAGPVTPPLTVAPPTPPGPVVPPPVPLPPPTPPPPITTPLPPKF